MNNNIELDQSFSSNFLFVQDMIIGKGHAIEDFQNFLLTKKIQGNFIENWTMDELLLITDEFYFLQQKKINPSSRNTFEHFSSLIELEEQKDLIHNNQQYGYVRKQLKIPEPKQYPITKCVKQFVHQYNFNQPQPIFDAQKYKQSKKCRKQHINPDSFLAAHNFRVHIIDFKQKKENMFHRAYISYRLQVLPSRVEVNRRYSSFSCLRQYLVKCYPEYIIPPIPKKNGSNVDSISYLMYKHHQRFLDRIIEQVELKIDPIIQTFLSDISDKEFISSSKDMEKQTRSINVQELSNTQGVLELEISSSIDNYLSSVKHKKNTQEDLIKQIRKQTKQVIQTNNALQNDLKRLADLFSSLLFNIQIVNNQNIEGKNIKAECVNIVMHNLFMRWGNKINDQNDLLKRHIVDFYSFDKNEFIGVREKIAYLDDIKQNYDSQIKKLQTEKDKLFFQQLGQHQACQQTQEIEKLRDNFAYLNHNIFQQVRLICERGAKDVATNIISFSQGMANIFEGEVLINIQCKKFWEDVSSAMAQANQVSISKLQ